jgi:glycosyltransferase involved in cell wall biosynthesis
MSLDRRLSVVIPTYNSAAFITRALASVRGQTVAAHEVIVVDDGSTDQTDQVVRDFGGAIYIRQPNGGVSVARNTGIRAASGDWVALLDADEEWLPHKTERQFDLLDRHPDIVWCGCNCLRVDDKRRVPGMLPRRFNGPLDEEVVSYFESVIAGFSFTTSSLILRKDALARVGGFRDDLRIAGDRDLMWRMAIHYPRVAYDREVDLIWHASTPGSVTKVNAKERSMSLQMFCSNLRLNQEAGVSDPAAFRYGRTLAYHYLVRHAAGDIALRPEVVTEARDVIKPTVGEGLFLGALRRMPGRAARALAILAQPRFH